MLARSRADSRRWRYLGLAVLVAASMQTSATTARSEETAARWLVDVATGNVQARVAADSDAGWTIVHPGQTLPHRSQIRTGPGAGARLSFGKDRIEMAETSAIVLNATADADAPVRIEQTSGLVEYLVETRPDRPFVVETPYLVAVVKGTTFAVDVDSRGAAVSVKRGVVSVSLDGRGGRDVRAGETAKASAGTERGLSVGPTPRDDASPSPPPGSKRNAEADAAGPGAAAGPSGGAPPGGESASGATAGSRSVKGNKSGQTNDPGGRIDDRRD